MKIQIFNNWNNRKTIITIIIVVLLALAAWYFFFRTPKPDTGVNTDTDPGQTDNRKKITLSNASFPLKKGSKGVEVLYLQAYMNKQISAGLTMDGDWGNNTEAAFQTLKKSVKTIGNYSIQNITMITTELWTKIITKYKSELDLYIKNAGIDLVIKN